MKKKLKSDSPLRAATCSPSSDADFIAQAKKWCEELGTLSDGEIVCKLADLLAERYAALASLSELHAALVRYEGDVDGEAPSEHRRMMERAAALLPENVSGHLPPRSGG